MQPASSRACLAAASEPKQGQVNLNALVTISANAAGTTGSSLDDIFGNPIRTGEVIRLRDLLYGLMIPSGNNAAVAIAEHVSEVLTGEVDVQTFVDLMNMHATTIGLDDTFYTNPAGFANSDATGHHTTARDLARLWNHAMGFATFRDLVKPRPTMADAWTFDGTTATGGTRNYALQTGAGYVGAEGWKNGGRNGCGIGESNEVDAECFIVSAKRIGRRLVAAGMQSVGNVGNGLGDPKEILDLAYARLFHPAYRGASSTAGGASRHALACPSTGRALSAVLPLAGRTRLVSWATNVNAQTYARLGTGLAPTGLLAEASTSKDIDLVSLTSTRAVTATRVGTNVELRLWSVPASGAPTLIGSPVGTRTAGVAKSLELVRLGDTLFASAALTTDGRLAIKSWRRTSTGLTRLAALTWISPGTPFTEVDVARSPVHQQSRFVALVAQTTGSSGALSIGVNATTGAISVLHTTVITATTGASLVPVPMDTDGDVLATARYAIVGKQAGKLAVMDRSVAADGTFVAGTGGSVLGGGYSGVEAAGFAANGLAAAVRMSDGTFKMIVWELRPRGFASTLILRIASHQSSLTGSEIETCRTPGSLSEGDLITAAREGTASSLRIRGWRIAPRPLVIPGGG